MSILSYLQNAQVWSFSYHNLIIFTECQAPFSSLQLLSLVPSAASSTVPSASRLLWELYLIILYCAICFQDSVEIIIENWKSSFQFHFVLLCAVALQYNQEYDQWTLFKLKKRLMCASRIKKIDLKYIKSTSKVHLHLPHLTWWALSITSQSGCENYMRGVQNT